MAQPAPRIRPATLADWTRQAPQSVDAAGNRSWVLRTAHFCTVLTEVQEHAELDRSDQPDEYMLIVAPGLRAEVQAGGECRETTAETLFIVPPGPSQVRLSGSGLVARVFSHRADDINQQASNAAEYGSGCADVAPAVNWPMPADGWRLRAYALAEYSGAANIARIFRSTNLMVNVMDVYDAARDARALMPHAHADYEQITLCMAGPFVHHLRSPWLPDSTQWRADEHLQIGSPSALVIPPRVVHTTQAMAAGCWLIDVFGPPRLDFSLVPGMVRNHGDYPMPADASGVPV